MLKPVQAVNSLLSGANGNETKPTKILVALISNAYVMVIFVKYEGGLAPFPVPYAYLLCFVSAGIFTLRKLSVI